MNTGGFWRYIRQHPFPRFCLVGATGFLIDASLLALLYHALGIEVVPARICSFGVALTATWLLNRKITFHRVASPRRLREWGRYALINGIGGTLNLGVFFGLTHAVTGLISEPMPALVVASACALAFNYIGSRTLVFTGEGRLDLPG
jgi:putative flippase GtrA